MSGNKAARGSASAGTAVKQGDAIVRPSRIPGPLKFPLLATLSLTISALLYSVTADYTADLSRVSRKLDDYWEVGALLSWRTVELAVGWFGNYDSYDLASLTLLSHGPTLYLLGTFYEVSPVAVTLSLIIDGVATYIPFRLLRPLSLAHAASSSKDSVQVPNNEIVTSTSIQAYTTILASVIYAATLHAAYNSYLPIWLVTYFDALPSVAPAHNTQVISLLPTTLLLGFAARSFIFTSAIASAPSTEDAKTKAFNPSTATLAETFWHNVWGFDKKTKIVILRTLTLMSVSGGNTFLQTWVTINGVETVGAAGYSAVWLVAAGITGAALGVVGAV